MVNIFYLHHDPITCAKLHVDKHVVKMILESCQMLCTSWHVIDPEHNIYKPPYKQAFKNHPCTKWVRESIQNYQWLCNLGIELCKEYSYRYGKIHTTQKHIEELSKNIPLIPDIGFTKPNQAMPDIYKDDDSIAAYHHYYFFEKQHIHSWKGKIAGREIPQFIIDFKNMFE